MFITFEGPEGSGKTTQINLLAGFLSREGYSLLQTREPGGTDIGEQIRSILHSHDNAAMVGQAEILLYSAARAQLVHETIRPALEAGRIVLCDRFYDSTLAYQGYGRELNLEDLQAITRFATGGLCPDLTLYLDIDPEEGLQRRKAEAAAEWNRLDALELAFHKRVYVGYQALIAAEPSRWIRINGQLPIREVQEAIRGAVLSRLPKQAG